MKGLPTCSPTCSRLPYVTRYTRTVALYGSAWKRNVAVIVDAGLRPMRGGEPPFGRGA
jgi:hypothetical protein